TVESHKSIKVESLIVKFIYGRNRTQIGQMEQIGAGLKSNPKKSDPQKSGPIRKIRVLFEKRPTTPPTTLQNADAAARSPAPKKLPALSGNDGDVPYRRCGSSAEIPTYDNANPLKTNNCCRYAEPRRPILVTENTP